MSPCTTSATPLIFFDFDILNHCEEASCLMITLDNDNIGLETLSLDNEKKKTTSEIENKMNINMSSRFFIIRFQCLYIIQIKLL